MQFSSILPPSVKRPPIQSLQLTEFQSLVQTLKVNVAISTWLLVGAVFRSLLVLALPISFAICPAILFLSIRLVDKTLIALGLRNGLLLDGVILKKTTAQIPNRNGEFSTAEVSGENVVIFLISAKLNHALGMFAPGFRQLGDYFRGLVLALSEGVADNGFLGQTSWSNTDARGVPEYLSVQYWRSIEHLHAFAHGPLHREGWEWWNRTLKEHPHLAIYHEVFAVSNKNWETVYTNCEPTGLGATSYLKKGDKLMGAVVADQWVSPLVDASKGQLRTMLGRMNQGTGAENEKYGPDPYEV